MYLLVPVVTYNKLTEKEEDVVLSLIDLTPASIISITQIKEDKEEDIKEAVGIQYKAGDFIELRLPFMEFLDLLNQNSLVNFGMVQHCVKYSPELNKRVEEGKRIMAQDQFKANNQQAPYWKE